ncbi:MAG: alcohol dehydrogenase catalytic domain-containing protein [Firmicutes bacterium]|nr:alcohol dehydrogenase catalytic domain-containing protein [Bacillota bacterium]
MRALVKTAPGVGNVAVTDVPDPAPGRGEVVVKVVCTTVCGTDVLVHDDKYVGKRPLPFPFVLGHEAAGEVAAVGPGVTGFRPGDRVGMESIIGCGQCHHCARGEYNLCPRWHHIGLTMDGSFAEYIKVPASLLIPLPEGVSFESASMLEPLSLAVHSLNSLQARPAQPTAIVGPGPIGLLHLLVAKAWGVGPILVLGRPGDEERLRISEELGADRVLSAASGEEALEAAREMTDGVGMELVIEATGAPDGVRTALELVAGNGKLVTTGLARETEVDVLQIIRKNMVWMGRVASVRRHFLEALRLIATGRVDPSRLITHRMPLEQGTEIFPLMKKRESLKIAFVS